MSVWGAREFAPDGGDGWCIDYAPEMESTTRRKKLLVFAHIPPPHHGQAVMVELMLRGLAGDPRFEIHHVDARMSDDLEDVGGIRPQKFFRLIRCCMEALRVRWKHGPMDLYYVPAPAKRSAVVRDWVVMMLIRPWFSRLIFHWHAFGLGHWATGTREFPAGEDGPALEPPSVFGPLEPIARWLTRQLLGGAGLSIVLTGYNRKDAELLRPRSIEVVPNGIPDPCPDFESAVLPERLRRQEERALEDKKIGPGEISGAVEFHAIFLAHCSREKGLFRAVEIVRGANQILKNAGGYIRIRLSAAGDFVSTDDRAAFEEILTHSPEEVVYAGFVCAEEKSKLLASGDCLLFPTEYPGETFGLVIAEALLSGMPVLVSKWRGLPELASSEPFLWQASAESLAELVTKKAKFPRIRRAAVSMFSEAAFHRKISESILSR